jgi:hypothetical protein
VPTFAAVQALRVVLMRRRTRPADGFAALPDTRGGRYT